MPPTGFPHESTLILGVDCATDAARTGLARAWWHAGRLTVEWAGMAPADGRDLLPDGCREAHRVLLALDAPLGWPAPLAQALAAHRAGGSLPPEAHALFRRTTDRRLHARVGKLPLEVGADRIARTAHAALGLLQSLRETTGQEIPLAWDPGFRGTAAIEVYPAATLRALGWNAAGYRRPEAHDVRGRLLERLRETCRLPEDDRLLRHSPHVLDAVLCTLAGAHFLQGEAVGPLPGDPWQQEGWIWCRRAEGELAAPAPGI